GARGAISTTSSTIRTCSRSCGRCSSTSPPTAPSPRTRPGPWADPRRVGSGDRADGGGPAREHVLEPPVHPQRRLGVGARGTVVEDHDGLVLPAGGAHEPQPGL